MINLAFINGGCYEVLGDVAVLRRVMQHAAL